MPDISLEPRRRGSAVSRVLTVLLVVGIPVGGVAAWLGPTAWAAWRADSEEVTGAVAVRRGGEVWITVSGHSGKTISMRPSSSAPSTSTPSCARSSPKGGASG